MSATLPQRASTFFDSELSSHSYEWLKDRSSITISGKFPKSRLRITQIDSRTGKTTEGPRLSLLQSETSTEPLPTPGHLNEQLVDLYLTANEGLFEDDQIKNFSERLSALVYAYGDATIISLAPFIIGEQASAESAAATLRCLSHFESPISYNFRIWLVERALQSSSSWTRDAAALALESMDDLTAIPFLQEAFDKEPNVELRQHFQSVLEYLQRKR